MNQTDKNIDASDKENTDISTDNTSGIESPVRENMTKAERRRERKQERKRVYPNAVDILAMIGIIFGSMIIAVLVGTILQKFTGFEQGLLNAIMFFLQFSFAIGFILIQRKTRGAAGNIINLFSGKVNAPLVLWGVLLIFAVGVVIEPLLTVFPDHYMKLLENMLGLGGWAILMSVVLAPILEETLFRGLIQGSIAQKYGPTAGILLSALIFGLMHGIPQQVINAFFVGIILGYIYYRTHSLITVILLHALNNGIAYLQMELFPKAMDSSLRDMIGSDKLYYVVYGVCVALTVVGAVAIIRNLHKQDKLSQVAEAENIADAE